MGLAGGRGVVCTEEVFWVTGGVNLTLAGPEEAFTGLLGFVFSWMDSRGSELVVTLELLLLMEE